MTSSFTRSPFVSPNPKSHRFPNNPPPRKPPNVEIKSQIPIDSRRRSPLPSPPWILPPPTEFRNPFAGDPRASNLQFRRSATEIPFSLRFVQLMLKHRNRRRPISLELGSVGNAIWSLAGMMEELQRMSAMTNLVADNASRDTKDSVVWLFWRVFFASPNLVIGLLVLASDFIVRSTEVLLEIVEEIVEPVVEESVPETGRYMSWSDIGILFEVQNPNIGGLDLIRRRRMTYEKMIAKEEANSMILSNYAQFLYRFAKDIDRAEEYFRRSVRAEPVDGEARGKYAMFLWEARGDMEGAEEMFLEAMVADPCNTSHQSNYSYFLLMTGGFKGVCFPSNGDDDVALSEL